MHCSSSVKAKGGIECATRIVEFHDSFGYNGVVLKPDIEAAIKVLRDEVVKKERKVYKTRMLCTKASSDTLSSRRSSARYYGSDKKNEDGF